MLSSYGFESLEFSGAQEFLDLSQRECVSCVISLNAGAVCYLEKPFVEDELLTCIQTALSKSTS
jgi:FixJ family two-component response regulator